MQPHPSPIADTGLFCSERSIRKDQVLGMFYGPLLSPNATQEEKNHSWELNEIRDVFGITRKNIKFQDKSLFRFLNHASNPNIELDQEMRFVALRQIHIGEELTISYGTVESAKWDEIARIKQVLQAAGPGFKSDFGWKVHILNSILDAIFSWDCDGSTNRRSWLRIYHTVIGFIKLKFEKKITLDVFK